MPALTPIERAAQIVARTGPDLPADAALRESLAKWRDLTPPDKTRVAHAVFATFRWAGWIDQRESPIRRVNLALELQTRFDRDRDAFTDETFAAKAVPDWVHDEVDFSPADLRSLQTPPALWLRTRAAHTRATAKSLGRTKPAPAPADLTGLRYEGDRDLYLTEPFREGWFEIQDLGSQLVGHACAPQPGQTWWDVCAGEGGKTLHLADQMQNKGLIWASDRSLRRLARLKERTARAQVFNYRSVPWDGGAKPPTKTKFDGILVDAPCSGIGTWRRNPHARWTTSMHDVTELAVIQRQLLENVAGSLKPGGRLIYAVCTLSRTETTAVADAFSASHPELEPIDLLGRGSQTTLGLDEFNANGMFLAGWRKAL